MAYYGDQQQQYLFRGIDPSQSRTGTQLMGDLEGILGRKLTDAEKQRSAGFLNYTDPSGNTAISGADYNRFMQYAASQIPGGAGSFRGWNQPDPFPQSGPVEHQPFNAPNLPPPPAYERPVYQRYKDFEAPDPNTVLADPGYKFALEQGQGSITSGLGMAGLSRSSRAAQANAGFAQGLATQYYDNAFNRQLQKYQTGLDEHRNKFAQDAEAYDNAYAPNLLYWTSNRDANQRAAELQYDRDWQRELYGRDDWWRRYAFDRNMEEDRLRYLGDMGVRTQ